MATSPDAPTILTIDEAAAHVREILDGMPADKLADLNLKAAVAESAIRLYVKGRWDPGWDDGSVAIPAVVKGAIEYLLGLLWEHRGDDDTNATLNDATVWAAIDRLLHQLRDPALA